MNSPTVTSFVQTLSETGLLDPTQSDELSRTIKDRFNDPKVLAKELIKRGWLTTYQANNAYQGKTDALVLGPFVLLEKLGEGGMGQVFKARQQRLGRIVALKIIRKERLSNPDAIRRFHREIQAAAQLRHPNVVMAYDADQVGDAHLFSMEFVEGTDLSKLIKDSGRALPVDKACDYIRQAALGLQHAFENGLVHRDIKPANLLLTKDDVVKVLDLGLARFSARDEEHTTRLTIMGAIMGTPDYIAPEQAMDSHRVDIRADLYSLGCTLYYLLTTQVPFAGGSLPEKLLKHQMEEAVPIERIRPDVPRNVAQIIRKLMAKKPEDRFQTPGELAEALANWNKPGAQFSTSATQDTAELAATVPAMPSNPWADMTAGQASVKPAKAARVDKPETVTPWPRNKRLLLAAGSGGFVLVILILLLVIRPFGGKSKSAGVHPAKQQTKQAKESKQRNPENDPGELSLDKLPPLTTDDNLPALLDSPDFHLQGEFVGRVGGGSALAAQVVAEGRGRFSVKFLRGGLPGVGWDGSDPAEVPALLAGQSATLRQGAWKATITRNQIEGSNAEGKFILKKISRRSPTLGAKPPPGATVLFDGSDAGNWQNGKVVEGNLLPCGVTSWGTFKDFKLHVEFRLPFLPEARGQARGNSGVYLQNRYELQILDSFGLPPNNREGGAVYSVAAPAVNMCLPPMAWQTYDIDFRAARYQGGKKIENAEVSVRHNGFLIHDRVEIPRATDLGRPEADTTGPIQLQRHGAEVHFRNIWVVETGGRP